MIAEGAIDVLACLRKHGQRLDSEIAQEIGMPLDDVRQHLLMLAQAGDVITCELTRYQAGRPVHAWQCRISGYFPPKAPGRKPS